MLFEIADEKQAELILEKIEITKNKKDVFPAIALVVSGGHTILILMKGIGKYKIIGEKMVTILFSIH